MNLTNDYLVLQDTIQDKPIELEKETDLPNGLEVVVAIRLKPEDGLRLAAGGGYDTGGD